LPSSFLDPYESDKSIQNSKFSRLGVQLLHIDLSNQDTGPSLASGVISKIKLILINSRQTSKNYTKLFNIINDNINDN